MGHRAGVSSSTSSFPIGFGPSGPSRSGMPADSSGMNPVGRQLGPPTHQLRIVVGVSDVTVTSLAVVPSLRVPRWDRSLLSRTMKIWNRSVERERLGDGVEVLYVGVRSLKLLMRLAHCGGRLREERLRECDIVRRACERHTDRLSTRRGESIAVLTEPLHANRQRRHDSSDRGLPPAGGTHAGGEWRRAADRR